MRNLAWFRASFRAMDRVFFGDTLGEVPITWMRWRPARTECVTFGRCWVDERRIELNKVLTLPWVTDTFALYILYHEALHLITGPAHDAAFRAAEGRFPHIRDARAFEHQYLDALIQASRVRPARGAGPFYVSLVE